MSKAEYPAAFWARVDTTGECWTWTAGRGKGYGRAWFDGRVQSAHRIAYQLELGTIPDGMCVMHICDTPLCVRPDHLRVGTRSQNTQEMYDKRRRRARLPDEVVAAVRERLVAGDKPQTIAAALGVDESAVWHIVHRRRRVDG